MNKIPDKKLITRSTNNQPNSKQKINVQNKSSLNIRQNKSSSNTSQNRSITNLQSNKSSYTNSVNNSTYPINKIPQQSQQKNIFYSQLRIQTNDKDVPLVTILKVNQQLQNLFIYHSTSIQKFTEILRIRSLNFGFRNLVNNLVGKQRNQIKIKKLVTLLNSLRTKRLVKGLQKINGNKNKAKIKQKASVVFSRLIMSKIQSNCRFFMKKMQEKKMMKIVLQKSEQDEQIKMKLNLQILKQMIFSKQFISKCRPLIKYNPNNETWLQNQLNRQNFTSILESQLQRYQKIRQNVDNKNPNSQSGNENNKRTLVRKKQQSLQYYENQIVLMTIKSFNLSLVDTKNLYQQKIQSLYQQIQGLKSQQRYVILENQLRQSQFSNKQYQSLINEFYSKSDQEIKKVTNQFQDKASIDKLKAKLLPVLTSQKNRYQKNYERIQKNTSKKQFQQYLSKMYQTRCFNLDLAIKILSETNQLETNNFQFVYQFTIQNISQIIVVFDNELKIKQFIQRLRRIKQSQVEKSSSLILIGLLEKFDQLNKRIKSIQKKKQPIQRQNSIQRPNSIQKSEQNNTTKNTIQQSKKADKKQPVQANKKSQQQINVALDEGDSIKQYSELIQKIILQFIRTVNNKYDEDWTSIPSDNSFLKKNLLPESKGRNITVPKNLQMNKFTTLINSQITVLVKNLKESIKIATQFQTQKSQVIQMIRMVYDLLLCKQTNPKQIAQYNQLNKKWIQLCKSKLSSQNAQKVQQKTSLINILNEILMLFKQTSSKNNNPQQNSFSQQLKKILKQKLQFERLYHQIDRKYLIKEEQFKLIDKQNKEYLKKNLELQKQLNTYRSQSQFYTEKQEKLQQTIQRLKQEIQVYSTSTKNQTQQNNKLTKQLNKYKSMVSSLNIQIQSYKVKQQDRIRTISQQKTQQKSVKKTSYTLRQYTKMQTQLNAKIKQIQQNLSISQSSRLQIQNSKLQLQGKIKDLQRNLQEANFNIQKLSIQIQKLKKDNQKWVQIQQSYQIQIQRLQKQKIQLYESKNVIMFEFQTVKKQRQNSQKSYFEKIRNTQILVQSISSEKSSLLEQINKLQRQIQNLKISINDKSKLNSNLQNQHLSKIKQLKANQQQNMKKMQQTYRSQIKQLQESFNNQKKIYQQKIDQLHLQIVNFNKIQISQNSSTSISNSSNGYIQISKEFFDPNRQIQSLKAFIQTLKKQNMNLQSKYNKLKKQMYNDDASTVYSNKSQINNQSISFYQKIIHDLKVQNDRLYDEIINIPKKGEISVQLMQSPQNNEHENDAFWLSQIRRKQSLLQQKQRQIFELKQKLSQLQILHQKKQLNNAQSNTMQKDNLKQFEVLQNKVFLLKTQYERKEDSYKQKIHYLQVNHNKVLSQNRQLKLFLQQQKQKSILQSGNLVTFNYSQILVSTKQVKQLFTSFIQATNSILYKLDRTSQIYLGLQQNLANMSEQYYKQQSQRAYESILSLVQQFKTVIQNNHQTLKSIYQNLVCHQYTKNALQLQYLKQLTFNILKCFANNFDQYSSIAQEFLYEEIQQIFMFKNSSNQKVKPIEQIFVNVQQFIIQKLNISLNSYKKQLHIKALQLDYLRQKFNIIVDKQLIQEASLINKLPVSSHFKHQNMNAPASSAIIHHNYQYLDSNIQNPHYQELNHKEPNQALNNKNLFNYYPDNFRPSSVQWVSKTVSNYQYRPATYAEQRDIGHDYVLKQNNKDQIIFRSSMQQRNVQNSFSNDRYS